MNYTHVSVKAVNFFLLNFSVVSIPGIYIKINSSYSKNTFLFLLFGFVSLFACLFCQEATTGTFKLTVYPNLSVTSIYYFVYRRRKDRHEASGFSRRPDPDSDEDEDYERERRKRSKAWAETSLP